MRRDDQVHSADTALLDQVAAVLKNYKHIKKVRVVSTIEYYLSD